MCRACMNLSLVDEPGTANCEEERMQVRCRLINYVVATKQHFDAFVTTDIVDYN